jgi:hypothetical protein
MSKKSEFEITIVADTNDGDYITRVSKISEVDLETIKPLIEAISKFKPYKSKLRDKFSWTHDHNYPFGDGEWIPRLDLGEKPPRKIYSFPEEIFDIFENLLPFSEQGFHTIESIEVTPFVKKVKLL